MSMKGRLVGVMFTWLAAAAGTAGAQELTPGAIVGSYERDGNAITIRTEAATVRLRQARVLYAIDDPGAHQLLRSFRGRRAGDS